MKNKKNLCRILSILVVVTLLSVTISSGAYAKINVPIPSHPTLDKIILDEQMSDELVLDESISDEDVELLAKSLELMYGTGQVTDGNEIVGFNKQTFEKALQNTENYEEIMTELEGNDLFAEPTMSTYVVACEWYLMKKKPAYIKAQNTCITDGLRDNYGPVTVLTSIANLLADREFTLAAKKILALGIRSNVAGVVVVLAIIMVDCDKKMKKKFPGKTNCY